MLCPNFKRLKNGINIGDKRTVIKNAIAIVINKTEIFMLSPPLTTNRPFKIK
jgi:hypothetical protein